MTATAIQSITDPKRFPLLSACSEQTCAVLMACDSLVFMAPDDRMSARNIMAQEGTEWHLYGDTRWPSPSVWVDFPLVCGGMSGNCGLLVLRTEIDEKEDDPLAWVAANNPLLQILPHERTETSIQTRLDALRKLAASSESVPGPEDSRPKCVQCYCIFHAAGGNDPLFIATYIDLLNDRGIPIPKYRTASLHSQEDVFLCRFALHSLFALNQGRRNGLSFLTVQQLSTFVPAYLTDERSNPRWARFHPSRMLRTRPALRALPVPKEMTDGIMQMHDFGTVAKVRRSEANLHMLMFERAARPGSLTPYQADSNVSMIAFIHRANGGAIYTLPDGLVEEFNKTDCTEVLIGDLQLPFASLFLSFTPPHPIHLADGAAVDGCYVVKQADEYLLMLTSRLNGVDYPRSLSLACLDPTFSLHLPAGDEGLCINDAVERGIEQFLAQNAPPEDDLTTTVEQPDGTVSTVVDGRAKSRRQRIELFRSQEPVFRACLNIIINAACFISFRPDDISDGWEGEPPEGLIEAANDPGATRRKRDRKRDAQRRIENGDFTRIKICGRDLFPDATEHAATGRGVSPRAHWRRGHWRRQRHGVGLKLVTLRWIRPTIVKKEHGPMVEARIYDVEKPEPSL